MVRLRELFKKFSFQSGKMQQQEHSFPQCNKSKFKRAYPRMVEQQKSIVISIPTLL